MMPFVSTARVAVLTVSLCMSALASAQAPPNPPGQLCIDDVDCAATKTGAPTPIKWHPGHYMDTDTIDKPSGFNGNLDISSAVTAIKDTPFRGLMIRYSWRLLEPTKGNYDFSRVRMHRDALAAAGKRLIIQVQDRDFSTSDTGTPPSWLYPDYLLNEPLYSGGWAYRGWNWGTAPKLWIPAVMDRQIALQAAIAAQFDSDPWIEIFSFEETALFNVLPAGYTQAAMATQYRRLADAMNASWPNTTACILTNFFHNTSALRDLIDYFISRRICVGGPDVRPDNETDGSLIVSGQFDRTVRHGKAAVFFHNEWRSLNGQWTMKELQDYNYNVNGAHYTTWVSKTGKGLTWSSDVRPWIIENKPPTRTACPEQYASRCSTN